MLAVIKHYNKVNAIMKSLSIFYVAFDAFKISVFFFFCLCPFLFFRNVPEVPIHIGVTAPIHFSSACGQINSKSLITYWVHRKQICRSLDQRMCVWPPKLKLTTYKSSLPLVCEEYCNDWCVRFNVKISLHHLFSCFPFATAGSLSLSTHLIWKS